MSSNERHDAETSVEDVAKYLEQSPDNSENPDDIQNLCASNSQQRECRLRQTHVSQGSDHSHPSWENAPNSNTTEGNRPWSEKGVKSFEISTLEDASDGAPTERGGRRQDTDTAKIRRRKMEKDYRVGRAFFYFLSILTAASSWGYLILAFLKLDQLERHSSVNQTLYAVGAKLIEICFSATYINHVNQHLYHRAADQSRGVSFAVIQLRRFVTSPSSLFTSFSLLKEVGFSFLTLSTLLAMIGVFFYTTAAQTLVLPSLSSDNTRDVMLSAKATTPYMGEYTGQIIEPILKHSNLSQTVADEALVQLSVALLGLTYVSIIDWNEAASTWVPTLNGNPRPKPRSPLNEGATTIVVGTWVNSTDSLLRWDRLVDNATVVYPHTQIATYMMSGRWSDANHFTDRMEVGIKAVTPLINTLCVRVSDSEAEVWNDLYSKMNGSSSHRDSSPSPHDLKEQLSSKKFAALREVAEIFQWQAPEDVPGSMSTDFKRGTNDSMVFHTISANDTGKPLYLQFPYYPAYPEENVVCKVKGDLGDGCTSLYGLGIGTDELRIDCGENGEDLVPWHDDDIASRVSNMTTPLTTSVLQMQTSEVIMHKTRPILDLLLQSPVPYMKYGDNIVPPEGSSTVAEALSVINGFAAGQGMMGTAITKEGALKLQHLPFAHAANESFPARLNYTTYRNGGSAHGWQYILFAPLIIVCLESTVILVYSSRSWFPRGKQRQILDLSNPQYFFQLGMVTSLNRRPTPETIEKEYKGRWMISDDADYMQYLKLLEDERQQTTTDHDTGTAELRDMGQGQAAIFPGGAAFCRVLGWFKGRF